LKIAEIYVHIAKGDREGAFADAISKDGRSYSEQVILNFLFNTQKLGADILSFGCEPAMRYICLCKNDSIIVPPQTTSEANNLS
jgi:Ubiquitin elongating factor core